MRLEKAEASLLKQTIKHYLPNAKVYLFGSRVDDQRRGGDIDILILGDRHLSLSEKSNVRYEFEKKFGEQKLDLVSFTQDEHSPFKDVALDEAILL